MRWIVGSSLQFRFLVLAIAAVVMVFGFFWLRNVPVDVLPEFAPPFVEIQTEALGLPAAEVEDLITVPLEELLTGVPWLESLRSESVTGLSSIILFFEPGTDLLRARQMVQERLTQAQALPSKKVAKAPVMLQPLSATSRVMMVGMSSSEMSLIDMSVLARWTIKPRLMGIPGVANVSVWGQRERQLQVQVDPQKLQEKGVSLDQVISTTGNALWVSPLSFLEASTPGSGGFIDTPNQRFGITHLLPISTPEDLSQVTIDGTSLQLGEVVTVVEDHQPLIGDAIINGGPGLLLVIEKFPGANTLEVTRGVEQALESLGPGLTGIDMDPSIFRRASFIETALNNLRSIFWISAVLVALLLFAFLYNWRSAVISLVAIPLSLMTAMLVLYLRGTTFNMIILAGLMVALAAIIDDSIVDVENIMRRIRQHRKEGIQKSTSAIILESSREVRKAAVYATLISLLVIMPIYFMEGISASFFQPLAMSYMLALAASMLVALTVTPALSMMLFRNGSAPQGQTGTAGRDSPLAQWLERGYERFLGAGIKPRVAFIGFGVMVLLGLLILPQLRQESLLPKFKERDILINWSSAPGTSHPAMLETANQVSTELRAIAGVSNVTTHVGRAITSDEVVSINSGKMWVNIDSDAHYEKTLEAIRATIDKYPELSGSVLTYLKNVVDNALSGDSNTMVVRIYGHDLDILRSKADEVKQALEGIQGLDSPQVEMQVEEDIVEITVDLAAAQSYGLKPGDVRRAATTLVNGIEVGNLFEQQKVFDVMVVGTPEMRTDLEAIRNLHLDTPSGTQVRLEDVASVSIVPTPNVIKREGVSRRIDTQASVQGRDQDAVAKDIKAVLKTIDFPLEYHPELLGEYAELQTAQRSLWGFIIAALVGIFLLLQAAFRSWRLAILTFIALPAALVGGALAVFFSGGLFSIGSLVGFLAVFGIAARHSIMLFNHYQSLEREGERFGSNLIQRGTRERLAPILMSALVTVVAILPVMFLGGRPGLEVLRPLAVVMVGGLVTSTVLTLFIMPAFYLWIKANPEHEFDLGPTVEWLPNVGRTADATD